MRSVSAIVLVLAAVFFSVAAVQPDVIRPRFAKLGKKSVGECPAESAKQTAASLFEEINNPQFISSLDKFHQYMEQMQPCFDLSDEVLVGDTTTNIFQKKTTDCAGGSPVTDPCCNHELANEQCCAPRDVIIQGSVPSSLNEISLQAKCNNPDFVRKMFERYARSESIYKGSTNPENDYDTICPGLEEYFTIAKQTNHIQFQLLRCILSITECESHEHCRSGRCTPNSQFCSADYKMDPDKYIAAAQCMQDNSRPEVINALLQTSGESSLVKAIEKQFFRFEKCHPFGDEKEYCEISSSKTCNDGSGTLCDNTLPSHFCGFNCDRITGMCQSAESMNPTKEKCLQLGSCQAAIRGTSKSLEINDKTTCEDTEYCTACELGTEGCTSATCSDRSFCLGFPLDKATCIIPPEFDKHGSTCTSGTRTVIGCNRYDIQNETECTAINGKWTEVPDTAEKCHAHKRCIELESMDGNTASDKPESECTKCGKEFKSLFTWKHGETRHGLFFPMFTWELRKDIQSKKWTDEITPQATNYAIITFPQSMLFNQFRNIYSCALSEKLRFAEIVACDCGSEKGIGCSNALDSVPMAKFRAIKGVPTSALTNGARVSLNGTSVPPDGDAVLEITVLKNILLDLPREAIMTQSGIGQVVGDGVRLDTRLSHAQLCLMKYPDVKVVNSNFTLPAFATRTNSGMFSISPHISAVAVGDMICSDVVGDQTTTAMLYPVLRDPESDIPDDADDPEVPKDPADSEEPEDKVSMVVTLYPSALLCYAAIVAVIIAHFQ